MAKVTVGVSTTSVQQGSRVTVRDSAGEVYIITTDGTTLEMFKGNNTTIPTSFSSQDTITGITGLLSGSCAIAIDSTDTIMCIYEIYDTNMGGTKEIAVVEYNTSTETFGTPANIFTLTRDGQDRPFVGVACDTNDDMHLYWNDSITDMGTLTYYTYYSNNITSGGTTFKTEVIVHSNSISTMDGWDIIIGDPDASVNADRPIIAGYYDNDQLYMAKGNALDATSFNVMPSVTGYDVQTSASGNIIQVESGANAKGLYVCGVDASSLTGNVYSFQHSDTWTQTSFNSSQSFNFTEDSHRPSMANKGDVIYVFFVEEQFTNDLELWTKTGTGQFADANSLSSDLPEVGTYNSTKCRWSKYNNNQDYLDYTFEDDVGLYFNSILIGTAPSTRNEYTQGYIPQVLF